LPHHFLHEIAPKNRFTLSKVEGELEVGETMSKMRQFAGQGGLNVEEGRGTASVPARLRA
jgi:hypothetical protein